ncbi:MAG: aminotransferase class I/II-fold pyridoxal phosphate-dependent enzyme [Sneathiellaceae bacterium]
MQNLDLNPRFAALGGYPFARLRSLLDGLSAPGGLAPIDMTIGEPRRPVPPLVAEVLARQAAGFGRYPPTRGSLDLRQAFSAWLTRRYRLPSGMIDPERHVMALNGTREGLFQIALACVPPQRNGAQPAVLIPNPFYQCYAGAAAAAGAEPVFLPATPATGHLPDLDALPAALLDRTALFYLCSPANPQGVAASAEYWRRLLALARQHGFVVAADECYAEIYRDRAPPGALEAAAESGALDNLIVFHSLSKRSGVPGLRGGICAGDPAILDHFTILRSYGGAPLPLPLDAAAAALWAEEAHVTETRAHYNAAYDLAARVLGNRYEPAVLRPTGGFFLWLDVGDGEAMAHRLWTEAGLRVLPGAYLTRADASGVNVGAPFVRVALVDDLATIESGLQRLAGLLSEPGARLPSAQAGGQA